MPELKNPEAHLTHTPVFLPVGAPRAWGLDQEAIYCAAVNIQGHTEAEKPRTTCQEVCSALSTRVLGTSISWLQDEGPSFGPGHIPTIPVTQRSLMRAEIRHKDSSGFKQTLYTPVITTNKSVLEVFLLLESPHLCLFLTFDYGKLQT